MRQRTITLPPLEQWQRDVYDAMDGSKGSGKIFVVKSKRQIGKSTLATILLIKFALESKTQNAMLQPTLSQARRVFKQICEMMEGSCTIKQANAQTLEITFVNGSEIIFKSAEQRESLRGYTVSGLLIIDEASYITDDIYEIVSPWVDAHRSPTLIISTPLFTDGFFYRMYNENSENVKSFDWSRYDTSKYLSEEKKKQYKKTMSDLRYRSEILGEFITDGSFVFGDIYSCVSNYSMKPAIYLGVDWASGDGGDYTWLTWMDEDRKVTSLTYFRDKSPTQQVDVIARLINQTKSLKKVMVEENSIGTVYYDFLRERLDNKTIIDKFNTSNESKRRIIEQLVEAFQSGKITIPNDKELLVQLQHYAMEKTSKGYTYNAVNGYHDDAVMSLAICYDMTVEKSGNYAIMVRSNRRKPTMAERYG